MRAWTLDYSRRTLAERAVPDPDKPGDSEVLVRVHSIGVCGTDRELALFHLGTPPSDADFLIIGHEALGEVVAVGAAVAGVSVGEYVVPTVRRSCDVPCRWCSSGRRDLCTTGRYTERGIVGAHGYMQEYTLDKERDLVRVPRECADRAVLIEPLSVVEKAIARAFELHLGEPRVALVLGAGTIGLLTAMALVLRGFSVDVCSLEPPQSRRARLAEQTGGRYLQRPDRKADIVIEAAGAPSAASLAVEWLAPLGVAMILGAHRAYDMPLLPMILGNLTVAGSVNASPDGFARAVVDLPQFPTAVLNEMVAVREWADVPDVILGKAAPAPKQVIRLAS